MVLSRQSIIERLGELDTVIQELSQQNFTWLDRQQ